MDLIHHEALVIGGGLAGLRCALALLEAGRDVALLTKVHPLRSHSVAAQGGINAALGNSPDGTDDTPERHAEDTVKGADYLADQDAVMAMCTEAPAAVYELEHRGTVFSRFEDGRIAQRPFGGAGFPRTCYAADRTGHNLLHTLYEWAIARGLRVYEEFFVTALAVADGRVTGCVALDIARDVMGGFAAPAVVLATGGYGRLFTRSTNALINTGDGAALALGAGCPLEDMEFVQFHPTTLAGSNILISEAARGEGGILLNKAGERFMARYAEKAMELAPRDIVARAIQTEVNEGRGFEGGHVHLDLTALGASRINERLPGIRRLALDFAGVDPVAKPLPVQPGQHYSMGGVPTDADGATPVPGLYACGEAACVSVHGANRLGGNSLLDTLVFGRRTGARLGPGLPELPAPDEAAVADLLRRETERITALAVREKGTKVAPLRAELRRLMFDHFGVFRDGAKMAQGLELLAGVEARAGEVAVGTAGGPFNHTLIHALELEFLLAIAPAVARGALAREESRGAHARRDFPKRDDDRFLKHTFAFRRDKVELEYREVNLGRFPVRERSY
ncbi:MAG TPA: FAD-dependent oxidoreductase [candidate division WOR-3 bacterium]|uniref:succinate dehydrogenase n=1 Tax=candidate division WOR-3 bacterium TaxID=2052148 RepID=A0A7V0XE54_UNCW3|nr:FAD-dependent oxidoreductase [candidate division WOR-3 bacterium]